MKKLLVVGGLLAVSACTSTPKTDFVSQINQEFNKAPSAAGIGTEWAKGYILVQPRAGLSDEKFDEIVRGKGGRSLGRLHGLRIHKIEVPENAEDALVRALSRNPSIKFAEKDMFVTPDEYIPNDPRYSSEWHLPIIQAPAAWDLSQGDGVTIAVIDSGVYADHPDLTSKLVGGWNVVNNTADTADIYGHGTKVASFAGVASNNGIGIASSGFNAMVMPIKVTSGSEGSAYISDLAEGIVWAVDNGAQVANLSYEVYDSSTISNAAQYMRNKGGVVVCSSGNGDTNTGYSDSPTVITVAATNSSDTRAYFSNYGDYVDVAAPGRSVLAATNTGGYATVSGTSFASPLVAGVVGLIMSANPNLNPEQVEKVLEDSADDLIDGVDWHMYYGHGRVNAARAVQLAIGTSAVDSQSPNVVVFSPVSGSEVKGNVLVEVNASDNEGINEVALYADGNLIGIDTVEPFQFSWDSSQVFDGEVSLVAKAMDFSQNEGVSSNFVVNVKNTVPVEDNEAPSISISNPADGSSVSRTVNITVDATDNVRVAEIQLSIDGIDVTSVMASSLSYSWNTRKVDAGQHIIVARAIDLSGNISESSVTVSTGGSTTVKGRKK